MTIADAIAKHRARSETVGELIFNAREIVLKRLQPGPSEDRELFDMLQTLHHIHGGNTVEIDLTDSLANWLRLERAARAVEEWWINEGQNAYPGAPAAIFALREALKS